MFKKLGLVFSNKTIMKRLGITLIILFVYRFLALKVTLPLIDKGRLGNVFEGGFFDYLNAFSGNALEQFSIIALGISPYITASIVVQMLQMDIVPILKEWGEQGEVGKRKLNNLTKYIGIGLTFIQAMGLLVGFSSGYGIQNILKPEVDGNQILILIYLSLLITAGACILLWFADLITRYGIGNGSSMIIAAGILTSIPSSISYLWKTFITDGKGGLQIFYFILIILIYILVILGVIYMQLATRKIPIQHANRGQAANQNLPIKLNTAGVMPVIFAGTLMSVPLSILGLVYSNDTTKATNSWINKIFNQTEPIGIVLYIVLIYIFTFFYTFLTVNPDKMADNLSKQNAYIPGVRPGEDTATYIAKVMFKVTALGATYLAILSIIPVIVQKAFSLSSSVAIGGTSILIIVGVAVETTKQIETEAVEKTYQGFLG